MKKIAILTLVFAMAFAVTPAFAGTFVFNSNSAIVGNQVSSSANTGSNYAGGADTGNGGSAGDITNNGGDADDNTTGRGGNGGNISGDNSGGTVYTGSATSGAGAMNVVNSNVTRVGSSDEEDQNCCGGFTLVKNRNRAIVLNGVGSGADTGDNAAKGADTGNGGSGSDIDNNGGDVDGNTTGNGGNAGAISGPNSGGFISTGNALSTAEVVNVINRNRTRIR